MSSLALDLASFARQAMGTYIFEELPIGLSHVALAGDLPLHHRDPFDRMLAAQAWIDDLLLVSPDTAFDPYDVTRRWA